MSLLNTILGAAGSMMGGQQTQQPANPMLNIILSLLANKGSAGAAGGLGALGALGGLLGGGANQGAGGLPALMGQMQNAGLGNVLESWIGKGSNLPISGEQMQQVLGSDALSQIASQLGLSQGEAGNQLADLLPEVIDKLTPDGAAPEQGFGDPQQLLGLLSGLMKR
jgi:uncharacterized protein YidB (DUF937 family)